MVFFLERIVSSSSSSSSKQENRHHLPSRKMCLALNTFESEISKSLFQFSLNSNSEILTISWIQKCLHLLPKINKAFAKLVSDIDYPTSNWETPSIDEYLNYSLNSMEFLNSITSSISHLNQARITVSHGLSLIETSSPIAFQRLKVIEFENSNKNCRERQGEVIRSTCSGKEWIIHQALLIKKQVWNWVCRVVESSIQGNLISSSCLDMKKEVNGLSGSSSSVSSNLRVCEEIIMERKGMLMEVARVNDGVVQILAAAGNGDEVKELRRRLEVLGKLLESVEEDVSNLFSEVLLSRNELLDIFQQKKHL